jgi:cob(I)alamin adenosyltransferase
LIEAGISMAQGLVQIYTGNGKGKTTAATGLILRALGRQWRVLLVRFLKAAEPPSGEVEMLRHMAGLRIIDAGLGGIYAAADRTALCADVDRTLVAARDALQQNYDLAVFDEFNGLFRQGFLSIEAGLQLIDSRPPGTELVLTGRHAPAELLERADLVTCMEAVKHPLTQGIAARRGIEY